MSSELGEEGGRNLGHVKGEGPSANSKGTKPPWPTLKNTACNLEASELSMAVGLVEVMLLVAVSASKRAAPTGMASWG